ncbi:acyl carrier protein [Streptomyces sp. I05A-00742]|uniref:acyl carrier protein n=1 Tax=Streptomyces sp. I05A-00742 TaxID=2732853 RepID=UPI001488BC12|nr:acyl carrier protein [Streptomyces sp. I05A-00742]
MHARATSCEPAVREALAQHSDLGAAAHELPADGDLYAAGLTSLASVRVMLALEERLSVEIPEERIGRALFTSIAHLSGVLAELTGDREQAVGAGR